MALDSVGDSLGGIDSVGDSVDGDVEGGRVGATLGASEGPEDGFKVEAIDGYDIFRFKREKLLEVANRKVPMMIVLSLLRWSLVCIQM